MPINREANTRIVVTLPRELKEQLEQLADTLTRSSISKITVSDLIRAGAKKIIDDSCIK